MIKELAVVVVVVRGETGGVGVETGGVVAGVLLLLTLQLMPTQKVAFAPHSICILPEAPCSPGCIDDSQHSGPSVWMCACWVASTSPSTVAAIWAHDCIAPQNFPQKLIPNLIIISFPKYPTV